jgi:hypothetical protein
VKVLLLNVRAVEALKARFEALGCEVVSMLDVKHLFGLTATGTELREGELLSDDIWKEVEAFVPAYGVVVMGSVGSKLDKEELVTGLNNMRRFGGLSLGVYANDDDKPEDFVNAMLHAGCNAVSSESALDKWLRTFAEARQRVKAPDQESLLDSLLGALPESLPRLLSVTC